MTKNEMPNPIDAICDAIHDDDLDYDLLDLLTDPIATARPESKLARDINSLNLHDRLELMRRFEFCPIHLCDAQICIDDDFPRCAPDCATFH